MRNIHRRSRLRLEVSRNRRFTSGLSVGSLILMIEVFGVERSTVSKVLRHKDRYLCLEDGSRSPIKKSKGKYPDIDRTLAKWVQNQQAKGHPITDENIKSQARFFWVASGNGTECPIKVESASWLEKFKQKNGLAGSRSRKSSIAAQGSRASDSPELDQTEEMLSPNSRSSVHASPDMGGMSEKTATENTLVEGLGIRDARIPFHSQSNASLHSSFSEQQSATYPSHTNSPLYSPDVSSTSTSYFPTTVNAQRQRSQTFPLSASNEAHILPPQNVMNDMPQYIQPNAIFSSSLSEMPPPPTPLDTTSGANTIPTPTSATSPYLPTPTSATTPPSASKQRKLHRSPSLEDARRGLEAAVTFLRNQSPALIDQTDIHSIRKVMDKLQLRGNATPPPGGLPGGLHRIPEHAFGEVPQ